MSSGRYMSRNSDLDKGFPAVEGGVVVAVRPGCIWG